MVRRGSLEELEQREKEAEVAAKEAEKERHEDITERVQNAVLQVMRLEAGGNKRDSKVLNDDSF